MLVDRLVLWVCVLPIVLNVVLFVDSTRGTGSVSCQVSIVGLYLTSCLNVVLFKPTILTCQPTLSVSLVESTLPCNIS